jgi:hypothetical protein
VLRERAEGEGSRFHYYLTFSSFISAPGLLMAKVSIHLYTKAPMVRARAHACKFNPLGRWGSGRLFIKNTILEPRGLWVRQTNGVVHFVPRKRDHIYDAPQTASPLASGFYLSAAVGRVGECKHNARAQGFEFHL